MKNFKVGVALDHVIDAGTYDSLDFDMAIEQSTQKYDFWAGGCTAAATQIENGDTIVGRNLDLYVSDKPAYICRTEVPGEYKTIGVGYTNMSGGSFDEVVAHGMPETMHTMLPYLCTDVLNEKGLYCEINMRIGEFYPDGTNKFGCPGTNPEAGTRISTTLIPRLVGQHCATVKEAVEYLKTMNLYTPKRKGFEWNFCFIMADATGDYGLVEIAENEISFLDKQQAQTNFYITDRFAEKQEYKCGLGRYETIMKGIDAVKNEKDMFDLINKTTYFQSYYPDRCLYDWRSENVDVKPNWTTDYVLDEAHRDEVKAAAEANTAAIGSMTRQELEAANKFWETILTIVVNCSNKTMTIRFFEDDSRVVELGL